ncbi:MAG TPA: kelch repeat-containing protein [Chitinophagaceae bacterium]|nr:kelch repeat-containing protein [Chitinophagaceae bacterium]
MHFTKSAFTQTCVAELNLNDTTICNNGTFILKLKNIDTTFSVNLLPRNAGNAVYLNGKVYLVGGDDRILPLPAGNLTQVEILDLSNNQVTMGTPFPNPRSELGLAVANNKIYAFGGYNGAITSFVNEYDPSTNLWTIKAPMPTPRSVFSTAAINDNIFCAGYSRNLDVYNATTNTWQTKAQMPLAIENFNSMVALNNKLYFIAGRNSGGTIIYDTVFEYDPMTNIWNTKSSMPSPRYSGAAVTDGNEIYYIGGGTTNQVTSGTRTIFIYNPVTDSWRQSNYTLPVPRARHSAVYANGKLWVFSGIDNSGNVITDVWNNSYLNYSIRWSTGDTTQGITVSPTSTTTYWGELYNSNFSCRDSVTITLDNQNSGINYPILFGNTGETIQLSARQFGQNYKWTPSTGINNPFISNPLLTVSGDQIYSVEITTAAGCITVDTLQVKINIGESVLVPSAFTPNNDGLNEYFKPILKGITDLDYFRIYNRWGELIYETKGRTSFVGWNGSINNTIQPNDVYVWTFKCTGNSGKTYMKKGTVLLIR